MDIRYSTLNPRYGKWYRYRYRYRYRCSTLNPMYGKCDQQSFARKTAVSDKRELAGLGGMLR